MLDWGQGFKLNESKYNNNNDKMICIMLFEIKILLMNTGMSIHFIEESTLGQKCRNAILSVNG